MTFNGFLLRHFIHKRSLSIHAFFVISDTTLTMKQQSCMKRCYPLSNFVRNKRQRSKLIVCVMHTFKLKWNEMIFLKLVFPTEASIWRGHSKGIWVHQRPQKSTILFQQFFLLLLVSFFCYGVTCCVVHPLFLPHSSTHTISQLPLNGTENKMFTYSRT